MRSRLNIECVRLFFESLQRGRKVKTVRDSAPCAACFFTIDDDGAGMSEKAILPNEPTLRLPKKAPNCSWRITWVDRRNWAKTRFLPNEPNLGISPNGLLQQQKMAARFFGQSDSVKPGQ